MGLVTTAIGALPTYAEAGLAAPALLASLRVVQGLAVGAEWGGAAVLSVEHAPPGRRGLFGSFTQLGSPAGMLLATLVFFGVRKATGPAVFLGFGSRIPFLLSIFLVAVGLFVRLRLTDAEVFDRLRSRDELARLPIVQVLRTDARNVVITTGLRLSQIGLFVLLTTYSLSYLQDSFGKGSGVGLVAVLISSALGFLSTPGWALLPDSVGRRPPYLFGALASVAALVLFFAGTGSAVLVVVVAIVFGVNVVHDAMHGPQAAWFAELFDTRVRYSGSSLGYHIGAVLSGGFAPLIAASLLVAGGGRPRRSSAISRCWRRSPWAPPAWPGRRAGSRSDERGPPDLPQRLRHGLRRVSVGRAVAAPRRPGPPVPRAELLDGAGPHAGGGRVRRAVPGRRARSPRHLRRLPRRRRRRRRAVPGQRTERRGLGDGGGDRDAGIRHHPVADLRAAVCPGAPALHAGPPHRWPGGVEHRHILFEQCRTQFGPGRPDPARPALRDRRRISGGLLQAVGGLVGGRRRAARPAASAACSPTPPRCTTSSTRAATSRCPGRSCASRRRNAPRCCSRPGPHRAASASPRPTPRRSSSPGRRRRWCASPCGRCGRPPRSWAGTRGRSRCSPW